MPRGMRRMDYRRMRDMRNPYGSKGGYVVSRRAGRDMLMMDDMRRYNEGTSQYDLAEMTRQNQPIRHDPYMPYDYARGGRTGEGNYGRRNNDYGTGEPYAGIYDFPYEEQDYARNRRDYERGGQSNMGSNNSSMRRYDGHYPSRQGGSTYYPIEAMGVFNGYYGMPEDYARGRRDYNYDYGYDYAGDYGEKLTKEELEHWNKKLMKELDEPSKNFFRKEMITQKAKQLGVSMDKFSEEELLTASLMMYTDFAKAIKPYAGANMDIYLKMGELFLNDPDAAVKYGEKLAIYHDCIVEGEDDD